MQQGEFLKIPETGDRGSVFCPAISENFETLDEHNHDGVNSPLISSKTIEKSTTNLLIAGWTLNAQGEYEQEITLATGYAFDTVLIKCIIASGPYLGYEINPTIIKTGTNKFKVGVLDNTFDLKVVVV